MALENEWFTDGGTEQEASLAKALENFWTMGDEAVAMQIHIAAPEIEGEILKLLGEPEFDPTLAEHLPEVYARVSARALAVAYGEERASEQEHSTGQGGR